MVIGASLRSAGRARGRRLTVLWHAIPETQRVQRARFASRLRFLGFGPVQDATWVAARDREQEVRQLLRQFEIERTRRSWSGTCLTAFPPVALMAQAGEWMRSS